MAAGAKDQRLDVRLSTEQKRLVEQAAAQLGQATSNFVVGTLVERAREVIKDAAVLELSNRDRDRLLAALDDTRAKPNAALRRAAKRYRATIG